MRNWQFYDIYNYSVTRRQKINLRIWSFFSNLKVNSLFVWLFCKMFLLIDRGSNPQSWIIMIYLFRVVRWKLPSDIYISSLGLLQWNSIYVNLIPFKSQIWAKRYFFRTPIICLISFDNKKNWKSKKLSPLLSYQF